MREETREVPIAMRRYSGAPVQDHSSSSPNASVDTVVDRAQFMAILRANPQRSLVGGRPGPVGFHALPACG
jgi:hypothetical protein